MKIETQLASFLAFFVFGLILGLLNGTVLKNSKTLFYICTIALTFFFMFALYNINGGKVHPYFLVIFIIGILLSKVAVKYCKKVLHQLKSKCKR